MSALKHILVVANQTVAGERLIAAVRARAAADPIRVTVICPQNDPSDSWVVDEAAVEAATRARLDATLAALRGAGIEASATSSTATRTRRCSTWSSPTRRPRSSSRPCRAPGRAGCGVTSSSACATARASRSSTWSSTSPRSRPRVSAHAATIDAHGGGETAPVSAYHDSLLRSPLFLGLIVFLASEMMLFGSFFTTFFYISSRNTRPPIPHQFPKDADRHQHGDPDLVVVHDALGAGVDQAQPPLRADLGLAATLVLGLTFLGLQIHEYANLHARASRRLGRVHSRRSSR